MTSIAGFAQPVYNLGAAEARELERAEGGEFMRQSLGEGG